MNAVSTTQTNINSRVTSKEVVQHNGLAHLIVQRSTRSSKLHMNGVTSSATNAHSVLLLGIHIDHVLSLQDSSLKSSSSVKTSLLITSDQNFQRTVLDGLIFKNGEASSNTSTIISTEGSSSSHQPLVIHNTRSQRISIEVNLHIIILLDDHIHMALEAHSRLVLATRIGGLSHNQITTLIHIGLATKLLSLLLKELTDLKMSPHLISHVRSTRNLSQGQHVLPNVGGLRKGLQQFLTITKTSFRPKEILLRQFNRHYVTKNKKLTKKIWKILYMQQFPQFRTAVFRVSTS